MLMATDLDFVEFIADQIEDTCEISYRKMFGEYALYSRGKVVALICDNQLFVKATEAGRLFIGEVVESSPYPGAKLAFLIQDEFENREWLTRLITLTEEELPMPKPRKKKKKKKKPER
jgi:TfoX/Sxy family transcriptional regulator of competence genes